jgi:tetratricopeptide (TPR) repeat protein
MRSRVALTAVVALALFATVGSGLRLERMERIEAGDDLLYLPNGKLLKVLSLGHGPLLADVFYLWAIQYYSDYEREDRYRYVEHVFSEVVTELDPNFVDAYWLGALILIIEAGDLDAGLRLLDRGFEKNPDQWILPYLAGWESYRGDRKDRAQDYFRRAMRVKDAPQVLPRLIAGIEGRRGSPRKAIALWQEVLDDPGSDSASRAIAQRQIRELHVRADVADLESAVSRFRMQYGRFPVDLVELVARNYIRSLPRDPAGQDYIYDPATGRVSSPAGGVLRAS